MPVEEFEERVAYVSDSARSSVGWKGTWTAIRRQQRGSIISERIECMERAVAVALNVFTIKVHCGISIMKQ